jgi:hypothetical protein
LLLHRIAASHALEIPTRYVVQEIVSLFTQKVPALELPLLEALRQLRLVSHLTLVLRLLTCLLAGFMLDAFSGISRPSSHGFS